MKPFNVHYNSNDVIMLVHKGKYLIFSCCGVSVRNLKKLDCVSKCSTPVW